MSLDKQFFMDFNKALMNVDVKSVIAKVSDNVVWRMVGTETIKGKEKLEALLSDAKSDEGFEIDLEHIIIEGNKAALNGTIHSLSNQGEWSHYSFCDMYLVNENDNKITEIISYVQSL